MLNKTDEDELVAPKSIHHYLKKKHHFPDKTEFPQIEVKFQKNLNGEKRIETLNFIIVVLLKLFIDKKTNTKIGSP